MNIYRLLVCLLAIAFVIGPSATLELRAQTTQQQIERQRREMERKEE